MTGDREKLDKIIITGLNKGLKPRDIAEQLQAKNFERPSGGQLISRKDINNIILRLRKNGNLPPLTETNKNEDSKKGNNMSTKVTVEQVVEATGMSQSAIAKKVGVVPGTLVTWKKKGKIPEAYAPKFIKLMNRVENTPAEITNTKPKKRKYTRKTAPRTPVLQEVTPEEVGITLNNTIFVVTKDKNVINELISRFL